MRNRIAVAVLAISSTWAGCGGGSSSPAPVPSPTPTPTSTPPPISAGPDARADWYVAHMTTDEKMSMVHGTAPEEWWTYTPPRKGASWLPGVPRLGIPPLYMADGACGVGASVGQATALPSGVSSAAGWDLQEAYKYGQVIGAELRAYGINVHLGGTVNLSAREPRGGRTFESKGEDPLLAGRITAQHILGVQDQHVMGGIKHYAFNDQESGRQTVNVLVDERSAHESDLLAFEIAVAESNVQSVMCSYNLVNGTYACENAEILNNVLKGQWQFPGFVMSDLLATHSTVPAALNGLDHELITSTYFGDALRAAIQGGQVQPSRLDDMVRRIIRAMIVSGAFDEPDDMGPVDAAAGETVAQEVAEQGTVLLKNSGVLPLAANIGSIAIIGSHADIGILAGSGSARVDPIGGAALVQDGPCPPCFFPIVWLPSSPMQAIQAKAPTATVGFNEGSDPGAAAAFAASADVAIVFVSEWESEAMDIPDLNFHDYTHATPIDQDAVVSAVAAANPHTIVVMENGGPKAMPWLEDVEAVVEAWYPGQRGGQAIANLLFGSVNPSGKLPFTFPASVSDLPRPVIAQPPDSTTPFPVDYSIEGPNVGYRWYAKKGYTPVFPFGFGLSYTTFAITDPELSTTLTGDNPGFQVSFDMHNTGSRDGAEVAQVYLQLPESTGEEKRLVGWQKVPLAAGAQQTITIQVNGNDSSHPLSYWDVESHAWAMASGTYTVYLGNSSASAREVGTFTIP